MPPPPQFPSLHLTPPPLVAVPNPFYSRLVEQTLDSCQLKRVKSAVVKVELRWLCNHLQRWSLLNRDFNLQELALIAVFAKQVGGPAGRVYEYFPAFDDCSLYAHIITG